MRIRLSILGQEIWSLQWCADCDCDDDEEDATPSPSPPAPRPTVAAGETHNFERDTAPLDPTDHYGEWEDRKRFGFGGVS